MVSQPTSQAENPVIDAMIDYRHYASRLLKASHFYYTCSSPKEELSGISELKARLFPRSGYHTNLRKQDAAGWKYSGSGL